MKKHDISVTVICPWWVVTGFHEAQVDRNGVPFGPQGRVIYTKRMMTAERCAKIILNAAYKRRREMLLGPGLLAVWVKLLAPGFLDWLTVKVFLKPAAKRVRAAQDEKKP